MGKSIPFANREENLRLSRTAVDLLLFLFEQMAPLHTSLILESNFHREEMERARLPEDALLVNATFFSYQRDSSLLERLDDFFLAYPSAFRGHRHKRLTIRPKNSIIIRMSP